MNSDSLTTFTMKKQRGLSLIEVLVTIIIMSVGLLGVAQLQGMSKQSSFQSNQRTVATNLADGIVERIRANADATASYHRALTNPLGGGTITSEPTPNCSTSTPCKTAAQLAAHDLWEFEQAIDGAYIKSGANNVGGLLNPQACIVFNAATGKINTGQLTVIISWNGMTNISDAATTTAVTCGSTTADTTRRQTVLNLYVVELGES